MRSSDRVKPYVPPDAALALEQAALMQAMFAVLPEFDALRRDAKSRPVRRTRHRPALEPQADLVIAGHEQVARFQRTRLVRRPCAQLAVAAPGREIGVGGRSEEHTSELQSLMRISYAVF